jgi:hypothetical protein
MELDGPLRGAPIGEIDRIEEQDLGRASLRRVGDEDVFVPGGQLQRIGLNVQASLMETGLVNADVAQVGDDGGDGVQDHRGVSPTNPRCVIYCSAST